MLYLTIYITMFITYLNALTKFDPLSVVVPEILFCILYSSKTISNAEAKTLKLCLPFNRKHAKAALCRSKVVGLIQCAVTPIKLLRLIKYRINKI